MGFLINTLVQKQVVPGCMEHTERESTGDTGRNGGVALKNIKENQQLLVTSVTTSKISGSQRRSNNKMSPASKLKTTSFGREKKRGLMGQTNQTEKGRAADQPTCDSRIWDPP